MKTSLSPWPLPPVFPLLARLGNVAPEEMRRTFNMGIGMIVAVPAGAADAAQSILECEGEVAPLAEVIEVVVECERFGGTRLRIVTS